MNSQIVVKATYNNQRFSRKVKYLCLSRRPDAILEKFMTKLPKNFSRINEVYSERILKLLLNSTNKVSGKISDGNLEGFLVRY